MSKLTDIVKVLILSMLFLQCDRDGCLYSSGDQTTRIFAADSFKTIEVWGLFHVELVQDSVFFVEGTGGSNVLDRIEATILNDTLSLYNYNNCFWFRDYERVHILVHFKDIKRILLHETSFIYSKDSITDNFNLEIRGDMAEADLILNNDNFFFLGYMQSGGRYKFRGKCRKVRFDGYYTSVVDASELESSVAIIRNFSISDYKVWVTDELSIEIHNRGNVYLRGNPEIVFDSIDAAGRLIMKNE